MLHRAGMAWSHEFAHALKHLKNESVFRYFGVSIYHPDDALKYADQEAVDMIQVPFNILDRRLLDNGFFTLALSKKKAIFIRSVFLQGLLLMDEASVRQKKMDWTIAFVQDFQGFIQKQDMNAKAFMLQAVMKKLPWVKLVIGMETYDQLMENINLLQSDTIPESCIEAWWTHLPLYPERLVNPALW